MHNLLGTRARAMAATALIALAGFAISASAQDHHDHHAGHDHDNHDNHDNHGDHHDHDDDLGASQAASLEAHVHGAAELIMALDGNTLTAQFTSPLWNIVGFEHAPKTPTQQEALEDASVTLEDGDGIVALAPGAGCALSQSHVDLPLLAMASHPTQDHHDHGDHHHEDGEECECEDEEHDHASHDDHDHDQHDHDEHHDDHDHGEHDHAEHAGHDHHAGETSTHSSVTVDYTWTCANPGALNQLRLSAFDLFGGLERVDVAYLSAAGQAGGDLTPARPVLTLP